MSKLSQECQVLKIQTDLLYLIIQAKEGERWEEGESDPAWVKRDASGKFAKNAGRSNEDVPKEESGATTNKALADYFKSVKQLSSEKFSPPPELKGEDVAIDLPASTGTKSKSGVEQAAIAAAAVLGTTVASYLAVRFKYRSGFKRSAELAKALAKEVKVPDELATYPRGQKVDCKHVTLCIGGLDGQEGKVSAHYLLEQMYDDSVYEKYYKGQFFVGVDNKEFNLAQPFQKSFKNPSSKELLPAVKELSQLMMKKVFKTGRNESAVKLASQAYAYYQKHGEDVGINLLGLSGGGVMTHEAAEILAELGVKVKVANMGTPWFMMSKKVGPSVTISSANDDIIKHLPTRDTLKVDSVRHHFLYTLDPEVRSFLGRFLSGSSEEADSLRKNWRTLSDEYGLGDKGKQRPSAAERKRKIAEKKQEKLQKESDRAKTSPSEDTKTVPTPTAESKAEAPPE